MLGRRRNVFNTCEAALCNLDVKPNPCGSLHLGASTVALIPVIFILLLNGKKACCNTIGAFLEGCANPGRLENVSFDISRGVWVCDTHAYQLSDDMSIRYIASRLLWSG